MPRVPAATPSPQPQYLTPHQSLPLPPLVIGIDPGISSIGLAGSGSPGLLRCISFPRTEPRWGRNAAVVTELMSAVLGCGRPQLVVIEGYSFASAHNSHQLGEIGGLIRDRLHCEGLPILEVPPAMLKKFVSGKGNAEKDLMRLRAYKNWGIEAETQHEVEAYCLMAIGLSCFGPPVQSMVRNEIQREVVMECLKRLR